MTKYIVELYYGRERKPYKTFHASLPNGEFPKFTNSKECFDFRIDADRAKVKYAENGRVVAEKYFDVYGNGRLRWNRDFVKYGY